MYNQYIKNIFYKKSWNGRFIFSFKKYTYNMYNNSLKYIQKLTE